MTAALTDATLPAPLGVVLTAGMGTRLRPLTPAIPKPMVPLLNRPLLGYALDLLADADVRDVVVVTGPDDRATASLVEESRDARLALSLAVQREPRGSGHAVLSAGAMLDGRPLVVLAVDTVLVGAARAAVASFLRSQAEAGLLLKAVPDPRAFGVAVLDGERVTDFEEKPAHPRSDLALVGLWMLRPPVIERLRTRPMVNAKGEIDLSGTVAEVVREGREVRGWVFEGEWLDGGTLEGLLTAQECLLDHAPRAAGGGIDPRATMEASTVEGPVLVGPDARVSNSRLERVVVGAGARLSNVTLRRALVVAGARLDGGSYSDVVVTASGQVAGPGLPS